jgi:hypothetical protein
VADLRAVTAVSHPFLEKPCRLILLGRRGHAHHRRKAYHVDPSATPDASQHGARCFLQDLSISEENCGYHRAMTKADDQKNEMTEISITRERIEAEDDRKRSKNR